jgi:hypothetical protein
MKPFLQIANFVRGLRREMRFGRTLLPRTSVYWGGLDFETRAMQTPALLHSLMAGSYTPAFSIDTIMRGGSTWTRS